MSMLHECRSWESKLICVSKLLQNPDQYPVASRYFNATPKIGLSHLRVWAHVEIEESGLSSVAEMQFRMS